MACGATCSCRGERYECITIADPATYGHLRDWCRATGDDPESEAKRERVRYLSQNAIRVPGHASPPPEPPSLLRKAASFAAAAAGHVAHGMPTVEPSEAARRLALCRACPNLAGNSCQLCGCNMPIKVTWAGQHCPIGQW